MENGCGVCVCVRAYACACACACVRVCVRVLEGEGCGVALQNKTKLLTYFCITQHTIVSILTETLPCNSVTSRNKSKESLKSF